MSKHVTAAEAPGPGTVAVAAESGLYERGIRRLAAGVSIVATEFHGRRFGLLSTNVTSVSAEPRCSSASADRRRASSDRVFRLLLRQRAATW